MLALIEGLPDTCKTWVALGADPWTLEQQLLRDIANTNRSIDATQFNVYRNRDETQPRKVEPIPGPHRIRTPEQQAADEAARAEAQQQDALAEHASIITHDLGEQVLTGQITMLELSRRIMAAGGVT